MTSKPEIYVFDNGLKVYKHHLIDVQLGRYSEVNLHEPEEEKWFLDILHSKVPPNGVFFDIGAAIGYYAILAKLILPSLEVHAFEPLDLHQDYLRENVLLNGISLDEIILHSEALAQEEGRSEFIRSDFSSSLVSTKTSPSLGLRGFAKTLVHHLRHSNALTRNTQTVVTTTLDTISATFNKPINLVKMDIQGYEFGVLKGASNCLLSKVVRAWIIGTHSFELHQQCLRLLQDSSYQILFEQQRMEHQPDGIIVANSIG